MRLLAAVAAFNLEGFAIVKLFLLSLIPVGYRTEITAYPAVNFSLFSTSSHFFFPFTFDFFLYNNPKPHRESLPDGNIPTSLTDSSHAPRVCTHAPDRY